MAHDRRIMGLEENIAKDEKAMLKEIEQEQKLKEYRDKKIEMARDKKIGELEKKYMKEKMHVDAMKEAEKEKMKYKDVKTVLMTKPRLLKN